LRDFQEIVFLVVVECSNKNNNLLLLSVNIHSLATALAAAQAPTTTQINSSHENSKIIIYKRTQRNKNM